LRRKKEIKKLNKKMHNIHIYILICAGCVRVYYRRPKMRAWLRNECETEGERDQMRERERPRAKRE